MVIRLSGVVQIVGTAVQHIGDSSLRHHLLHVLRSLAPDQTSDPSLPACASDSSEGPGTGQLLHSKTLEVKQAKKNSSCGMWTTSAVMMRRHEWLTGCQGDAGVELLDLLAKVGLADDPSSALLAAALQHRWPMLALLAACHGCTPLLCMATWLLASLCPSNAAPDGEPHSPVGTAALLRLLK